MFYLIRHGKTDYSQRDTGIFQGWGVNLAPLSAKGIEEINSTARDIRLRGADIILSSPYTRALHTAAILSKALGVDIAVETYLHEWTANKNYIYEPNDRAELYYQEYESLSGVYPANGDRDWEERQRLKERIIAVLEKYSHFDKVIVACHGMLIQAVTNSIVHPDNGEIVEFVL